jgi:hypothetical protein
MAMQWTEIPLGVETGRVEIVVTDAMIDTYLASMELDIPWFTTGTPPYGSASRRRTWCRNWRWSRCSRIS